MINVVPLCFLMKTMLDISCDYNLLLDDLHDLSSFICMYLLKLAIIF